MRIIVTGSLGNISKPLAGKLVREDHSVIVVSSSPEKQKDVEAIGANAAIGNLDDVDFLASTFTGADAAYCMIPMNLKEADLIAYFNRLANNYSLAVRRSRIKRVILLSGWVAGVASSYKDIENIFNELPDVAVTHIRPGYFYSNFFDSINTIKEKGVIAATFGGEDRIVFSAPSDIADAIADEITHPDSGGNVRYVASDEMTCNEAATILGATIGRSNLKWVTVAAEEMQKNLERAGLSPRLASDIVEMQAPIHKGLMPKGFARHGSEVIIGKIKLADFAKEFADFFDHP